MAATLTDQAHFLAKCRKCKAPHRFTFELYGPRREPVYRDGEFGLRNVHEWAWNGPTVWKGLVDTRPVCRECGYQGPWRLTLVKGTYNPDKGCNARCMGATGPSCECSCAGENHGGKWTTA